MMIETGPIVAGASMLYNNRTKIADAVKVLRRLVTRGGVKIITFGSGGTGKTTLGHFLMEGNSNVGPSAYIESIGMEKHPVGHGVVGTLLVPPGQERRREDYWPELYRSFAQGKTRGIINVVAYGYHSFAELGYEETKYFSPGMSREEFVAAYTDNRRALELDVIRELTPHLLSAEKKIWMVTLVTKQDIWWKERAAVRDYYMEGSYSDWIKTLQQKRGERLFRHEYLSASLVMSNFASGRGELLAPTTEGYDQNIQMANLHKLVETVKELSTK